MNIPIKTPAEIKSMRTGGKILAEVLDEVLKNARPGISTFELDQLAENLILQKGGKPGFKGYQGFPATLCTAINEVIVHGIPRKDEILKQGDLFTVDCGVIYDGLYTDAARSTAVGTVDDQKQKLLKIAEITLNKATDIIKAGITIDKISHIIEETITSAGFKVIKDLTGHGVGRKLHEPPIIPNFWDGRPGPILKAGMTLAIEPIFSVSTEKMKTLSDKWTLVTIDNSPAVQVENTILVTPENAEVLTTI